MDAGAAVLHLAVDTGDGALAVKNRRSVGQLDQIRHQPLAKHRSCFEERLQIVHKASGEGYGSRPRRPHATRLCPAHGGMWMALSRNLLQRHCTLASIEGKP